MITDLVVVPGAPLLLPEYQGRVPAAPGLMESCVAAVRDAVATAAHVVVVHATDREPRSTRPAVGLRVADHLLASTHLGFEVEHVAVPWDAPTADCIAVGREVAMRSSVQGAGAQGTRVAGSAEGLGRRGVFAPADDAEAPPTAAVGEANGGVFASGDEAKTPPATLLVVADGSARRTEKAPGHLDPRSHEVDDVIVAAVRGASDGGLDRLLDLDAELCAELLVAGRAPLQVLAAAAGGPASAEMAALSTTSADAQGFEVVSCEVSDPFGVLYVVAHLARSS